MTTREFPPALPHSDISEVFPDIFFVTGSVEMPGRMPMRFSRNMTILRDGTALTLVNSVRLTEAGLAELDALGEVKHVIRLAGFHGMDDPFYKDRYGAETWSVDAPYRPGFNQGDVAYFVPDHVIDSQTELPIRDARVIEITSSTPSEGLLFIDREGGILVSGDCLQNWGKADAYFSVPARIMMKLLGFLKPHNIGPGWLRFAKPDGAELKRLLDMDFDHVLPSHGAPVIGQARDLYKPKISAL